MSLKALFGNQLMRILRNPWKKTQPFAEEMHSILSASDPLQLEDPVELQNNTTGPAIIIYAPNNADQNAPQIQVRYPNGGYINFGQDGINFFNPDLNSEPMTYVPQSTGAGKLPIFVSLNTDGEPIKINDSCPFVLRTFKLLGDLPGGVDSNDAPSEAEALLMRWNPDTRLYEPSIDTFVMNSRYFLANALTDDIVFAWWECKEDKWYVIGLQFQRCEGVDQDKLMTGELEYIKAIRNMTINGDCTVTLDYDIEIKDVCRGLLYDR